MNRALQKLVYIYFIFMLVFVLMKPVFMTVYYSLIHAPASQWLAVVRHGWSMDGSVAGYLTVIPALLTVAQLITRRRWPAIATDIYMGIAALTVAALYTLDLGLYGSWGFRLDMTPVFYFTTSPSAAMASVEWWHWVCGIIGVAVITSMIWFAYRYTARRVVVAPLEGRWRVGGPVLMLLISALLVIPIRGSLTVSTMNPSFACFSDNQRLNHAATNPLFNLLYSATHQAGFDRMYRFMSDDDARRITAAMLRDNSPAAAADSVTVARFVDASGPITLSDGSPLTSATQLVKAPRPDIVLIILESFSSHLMPSLGGADVASGLDSIGRDGVLFGNVFASSFRTDRALTAILSGFPATTNTSLLKFTGKFPNLPSMPAALKSAGYSNSYFYGGDANFTNMSAYLRSAGFGQLVSDKDFTLSQRASKWGAHDGVLFDRALHDIAARVSSTTPSLTVVQTSSSHEPFEVPYSNPRFADNPRANAFAYTDSCLTAFVGSLRRLPSWNRTLVVIVPDHWGCWPQGLDPADRHRIPLVLTGGALAQRGLRIDKTAMQTDLAATILAAAGVSCPLTYSRDILDPATRPVAVFTEPSMIGIVTPADTLIYNPDGETVIEASGRNPQALIPQARAFMRDISNSMHKL